MTEEESKIKREKLINKNNNNENEKEYKRMK